MHQCIPYTKKEVSMTQRAEEHAVCGRFPVKRMCCRIQAGVRFGLDDHPGHGLVALGMHKTAAKETPGCHDSILLVK